MLILFVPLRIATWINAASIMVTDGSHNKHQKKWLPAATMVLWLCALDF